MSKHRHGKIEKSYLTELFPPVMRLMANMEKNEDTDFPRTLLDLPWTTEALFTIIFTKRITWLAQWSCENDGKSKAADNFLNKILPFLAKVVVQDGIYYIRDFPEHQYSRLLKKVMPPDFERWAQNARQEIE